jgi:hypothetical protein
MQQSALIVSQLHNLRRTVEEALTKTPQVRTWALRLQVCSAAEISKMQGIPVLSPRWRLHFKSMTYGPFLHRPNQTFRSAKTLFCSFKDLVELGSSRRQQSSGRCITTWSTKVKSNTEMIASNDPPNYLPLGAHRHSMHFISKYVSRTRSSK